MSKDVFTFEITSTHEFGFTSYVLKASSYAEAIKQIEQNINVPKLFSQNYVLESVRVFNQLRFSGEKNGNRKF